MAVAARASVTVAGQAGGAARAARAVAGPGRLREDDAVLLGQGAVRRQGAV